MTTKNLKINDTVFLILFTIALSALAYVLTTLCLPAPFYTNDEVLMRSIANGSYTGANDGHLIYIMYCLGIVFAGLYKLIPSVNWYDFFMLFVHYLCWALIIGKVGSFFKERLYRASWMFFSMCLIVTVDSKFVFFHQYTILAGVAFATGMLFLWGYFQNPQNRDAVISVIFLTFSLWIRKQVFFMGIPFVLLLFFVQVVGYLKTQQKSRIISLCKLTAAIIIVSLLSFAVEKAAYSSNEWREFLEYNSARTDLVDFYEMPEYEEAYDILEKYGISEAEYAPLYLAYFSFMDDKYSTELLKELAARASQNSAAKGNSSFIKAVLLQVIIEWKFAIKQPIGLFILLFAACNIVLGLKNKKFLFTLASLGALAYQCVFVAYFIFRMRFPERVSYTFYFMHMIFQAGMLLCLLNGAKDNALEKKPADAMKKAVPAMVIICGVGLVCVFGSKTFEAAAKEDSEWQPYRNEVSVLCNYFNRHNEDKFIVSVPVACFLCDEMSLKSKPYPENALSLCYWTCGSPLYGKNSVLAGMESPYRALDEDGVFFVFREGYDTEWLINFYEHSGNDVVIDIPETLSVQTGKVCIAKIRKK